MKIHNIIAVLLMLTFSVATAAPPPTAAPGTPSGLIPIKHPPYKAICISGFTPNPATYDQTDLNARFTCEASWRCPENLGFYAYDGFGSMGLTDNKALYYTCNNVHPDTSGPFRAYSLTCAAGFTKGGPYDQPNKYDYRCTSEVITCSGGLVTGGAGEDKDHSSMYYDCRRPPQ